MLQGAAGLMLYDIETLPSSVPQKTAALSTARLGKPDQIPAG